MDSVYRICGSFDRFPIYVLAVAITAISILAYAFLTAPKPIPGFPIVTLRKKGIRAWFPKTDWLKHGKLVISKGLEECPGCFQPPKSRLQRIFAHNSFPNYPGFEAHREGINGTIVADVIRTKITQSLGIITEHLVDETYDSLRDLFGEPDEWQTHLMKDDCLHLVTRLSSRVFAGKELCRNEEFLHIAKIYMVDTFQGLREPRRVPGLLRPYLHWIVPTCIKLRREVRDARRLMEPQLEKRRREPENAIRAGEKLPRAFDAIGWMMQLALAQERKVDVVAAQLMLSSVAIHTTSLQFCDTPQVLAPLREEVIRVLQEDGWSKLVLYKMRLLDSFLKEVQRTYGITGTPMRRHVMKDIVLHDGTVLPAGTGILVSTEFMQDSAVFPEAEQFDMYRFLRLRDETGEEHQHQFMTTTATHMGFGHGQYACPGRFFASNELKIALCFLMLNYEFRYRPGESRPESIEFLAEEANAPFMKIQVRRREPEIDLMDPKVGA